MNPRLPLGAAIAVVLAAGVALVLVRPGDLGSDDGEVAAPGGTVTTTSTTSTTSTPSPGSASDQLPGGTGTTTTATTTSGATAAPPRMAPTTTAAPLRTPGIDTGAPGAGGDGTPRHPHTGAPGGSVLGVGLLLAALATRWSGSRTGAGCYPSDVTGLG